MATLKCRKCSAELPDGALYCPYCGVKQTEPQRKGRTRPNGSGYAYRRGHTWTARVASMRYLAEDADSDQVYITLGGFRTKSDALNFVPVLKAATKYPKERRNQLLREAADLNDAAAALQYVKSNRYAVPDSDITLKALYTRWLPQHADRISKSTLDGYKAAFQYLSDIHSFRFTDLGTDDMQECIDACPRGRRTKENIKSLCMMLYKYAGSRKLVIHNYAQYLYCGRGGKGTRPALTFEHVEAIRGAIGTIPMAEYVYCMIYTGFRPNEMLRLKKTDLHKKDGVLYLVGGFKTAAGTDRIVTLSPCISPIVQSLADKADLYLFPAPDGTMMRDDYFREKIFYPLLAALDIQDMPSETNPAYYKPYSCRHTFSNMLKNVQGSNTDKAALIGHADTSMTEYYQSADIASMAAITDAISHQG